jgi:hypothetical protein
VRDQYACLNEVLLPALRDAGIDVLDAEDWDQPTRPGSSITSPPRSSRY